MRNKRCLTILCLILVNLVLFVSNTSAAKWRKETVDNSGDVGKSDSIAVDKSGKVHISYCDIDNNTNKYATNASGSWVTTTIDSNDNVDNVDFFTSIALDSSDKVHISYRSYRSSRSLKYATNVSGSWTTTTVDSTCGDTDIAIDSSDKIHISYYDNDKGDLKYATNASGSWVTTTVDSDGYTGYDSSIALDTSGKVYISYFYFSLDDEDENATLKYATNASGSWVTTVVDSDADSCYFSSIAVDKSDKVHITYFNGNFGDLIYITNKSGTWVRKIIDKGGSFDQDGQYGMAGMDNSVTLDSSDKVHISYLAKYYIYEENPGDGTPYGKVFNAIMYVTNANGSWVKKTIDKLRVVRTLSGEDESDKTVCTSIALDTSDKVHISYYNSDKGILKHATNAARK